MQPTKKILLLEDDEFTRLMAHSQLEQSGFSVESYSCYEDAYAALSKGGYHLVLTDLHIQNVPPDQLISTFREIIAVPLVVMSNTVENLLNVDLIIHKPLNGDKIRQIAALLQENDLLDLSKVYEFACGDEVLVSTFLNSFVENFTNDLRELKAAAEEGNSKAVKDKTHKMQSSVAYYNHKTLTSSLIQLEGTAEHISNTELKRLINEVERYGYALIARVQEQIPTA